MAGMRRRLAVIGVLVAAALAPACGTLLAASDDGESGDQRGADPAADGAAVPPTSADGSSVNVTDPNDDGGATDGAALSPGEIYRAAVLADGPIAYWRFGEPSTATSCASETNKHPASKGIGVKAPRSEALGLFGTKHALLFDGTTGQHAAAADLPFLATAFTFEAWIHVVTAFDGNYRHLVQHSNGSVSHGIYSTGTEGLVIERIANGNKSQVRTMGAPSGNAWHHVVATRDATLHLWIDGVEQTTAEEFASSPGAGGSFFLGAKSDGEPSLPSGTRIAAVAVYDKAIASARIVAHYDLGKK